MRLRGKHEESAPSSRAQVDLITQPLSTKSRSLARKQFSRGSSQVLFTGSLFSRFSGFLFQDLGPNQFYLVPSTTVRVLLYTPHSGSVSPDNGFAPTHPIIVLGFF